MKITHLSCLQNNQVSTDESNHVKVKMKVNLLPKKVWLRYDSGRTAAWAFYTINNELTIYIKKKHIKRKEKKLNRGDFTEQKVFNLDVGSFGHWRSSLNQNNQVKLVTSLHLTLNQGLFFNTRKHNRLLACIFYKWWLLINKSYSKKLMVAHFGYN